MILSEYEDITETIASYDYSVCDKCNGDGKVEFFSTISNVQIRFIYTWFFENTLGGGVLPYYLFARNELHKKVECPKCLGKRNIAVFNQ